MLSVILLYPVTSYIFGGMDVVLEPSDTTPTVLEEQVTALLSGTPVARIRTTHDWKPGKLTRTVLPPLEPLP